MVCVALIYIISAAAQEVIIEYYTGICGTCLNE